MKHSQSLAAFAALALTVFFAIGGSAQQTVPARGAAPPAGAGGRGRGAPETATLGAGTWDLPAGRGRVHVSVVTKGIVELALNDVAIRNFAGVKQLKWQRHACGIQLLYSRG